jgi:hypothetical protein
MLNYLSMDSASAAADSRFALTGEDGIAWEEKRLLLGVLVEVVAVKFY